MDTREGRAGIDITSDGAQDGLWKDFPPNHEADRSLLLRGSPRRCHPAASVKGNADIPVCADIAVCAGRGRPASRGGRESGRMALV